MTKINKMAIWEGKVTEQKQKQFWNHWNKWQNLGACKIMISEKNWNKNRPNLTSAPWLNLNLKILTKPSFLTLTKIQLRNLNPTLVISSKILTKLQLQAPDQTLSWKSEQKFSFMTKPQLPNLQQTVASTTLIIKISNSNNLKKFWGGPFIKFNQVY